MSDTVKLPAPTETVQGKVDQVNNVGVKVDGTWHDYGRTFQGDRLPKEAVGLVVILTLVASQKTGKSYIRSIEKFGEAAEEAAVPTAEEPSEAEAGEDENPQTDAPQEPKRGDEPASAEAKKYASDLAQKAGLSDEDIEKLTEVRFKKDFASLTKREASLTITFLGGYRPDGSRFRKPSQR